MAGRAYRAAAMAGLLALLGRWFGSAVWPLLLTLSLKVWLDPPVLLLSRYMGRERARTLVFLFLGSLLFAGGLGLAGAIGRQGNLALRAWPRVETAVIFHVSRLTGRGRPWAGPLSLLLGQVLPQAGSLGSLAMKALGGLLGWLGGLPGVLLNLLLSLAGAYFLGRHEVDVHSFFLEILPPGWRTETEMIGRSLGRSVVSVLLGELAAAGFTAAVAIAGLYLLGERYALLLGILAGVLDFLPVIGPTILFLPWAILAFLTGSLGFGLGLIALLGIIGLGREVVEAKLLGRGMGVHPFLILLAVYWGWRYLGPLGFIWGPLAVFLGRVVWLGPA